MFIHKNSATIQSVLYHFCRIHSHQLQNDIKTYESEVTYLSAARVSNVIALSHAHSAAGSKLGLVW